MNNDAIQRLARAVIETEARAVSTLAERIDAGFLEACRLMLGCEGRVIVIGVGKSGHIGHKIAATLASTGLPWWQTPDGLFRVWLKRRIGDMTGGSPDGDYYYLVEDVPWTMYFDGPIALHAAYWHDGFG